MKILLNMDINYTWRKARGELRQNIPETSGGGANGTDISRNLIPNFGCTARGWPKVPGNRNNQVFPFQSTIPARAQFLRARKSKSTWL